MKCSKCSTENPEGTQYCSSCGNRLVAKDRRKLITRIVAVVVVLVVIFSILALAPIATARVVVTVQSGHIIYAVHYQIFLNGALRAAGDLDAGASATHDLSVGLGVGLFSKAPVVVLATSTGGGFGAVSDQKTLELGNGQIETVSLSV